VRGVVNRLLYFLMSFVFLLTKEEARHRQPTDLQEPKASDAAVPTLAVISSVDQKTIRTIYIRTAHVYSACVQRIRTAHTTVPTEMAADGLTKPLTAANHAKFVQQLRMKWSRSIELY
jgi:hypothetical protein